MNEVKMELPIVRDASNFTFEDLKSLIVNTPIKDWTESHGQSSLTFLENSQEKAEISYFAGYEGEGFLIRHSNREDINDILYVVEGEHTNKVCEFIWSGDANAVFCDYLVSKETLLKAVEYFMKTGTKFTMERLRSTGS